MPPAIPADLAPELVNFHEAPEVWWVSQMVKYIMRPDPTLASKLEELETMYQLGTDKEDPIVGIQIRRSDKYTEARFYSTEEYMRHVSRNTLVTSNNGPFSS